MITFSRLSFCIWFFFLNLYFAVSNYGIGKVLKAW